MSKDEGGVYFVWVKSLRGVAPVIWHDGLNDRDGHPRPKLFSVKLDDADLRVGLRALALRYPPPEIAPEPVPGMPQPTAPAQAEAVVQ